MPWNEPGKNGNNPSPPDLDKLLGDFLHKVRGLLLTKKDPSSNWQTSRPHNFSLIAGIAAVILFVVWFVSGLFIVNPAEQTVVLRFGKFATVEQPGLHWFARFIESKYTVDVQKIYSFSLQGNFLTKSSEQNDVSTQYAQFDTNKKIPGASDQSKNLVNVELNVQYRIADPRAYLFNVVNPDDTVQQVASGALSDVIGTMKLDEVLTTGRELLSSGVLARTKQVVTSYSTGLEVIAVTLRKVQAPDQVRAAFNDVNRADQDKSTYIQQAQAYASKVVPLAMGDAARTLADANAYQQQVVLNAQAHVARYKALVSAYSNSPDITRQRLYFDAMETIFQNTTKILVEGSSNNNLLYLPLDKLINKNTDISAIEKNVTTANNANQAAGSEVKHDAN